MFCLSFDIRSIVQVLRSACHRRRDFEICVQCPSVIRLIGARALTVIFIGTLQYKWNLWTRAMPLPYPGSFGCSNPTLLLQAPLRPIVSCSGSGMIGDGTMHHRDRDWQNSANNVHSKPIDTASQHQHYIIQWPSVPPPTLSVIFYMEMEQSLSHE